MKKYVFLLFLFIVDYSVYCTPDSTAASTPLVATPPLNKAKLTKAILLESGFYLGGMSYLNFIWYKDSKPVPFHLYNDSEGYLQVDKFGHFFGSYLESYIGYSMLRNAGVKKNKALLYGATMGIILQTPIEVFDGYYEGWGFSWSDMLANTSGSALIIGQELLFNEQLIRYKFSFNRSPYANQANGYLGHDALESLFYDYNGHTYWFSGNLNHLLPKSTLPSWVNVAVGYGANGMFGEFSNLSSYRGVSIPPTERYRQYFLSLDIDWSKIPTKSKFMKAVFEGLNFIKIPFPTLEYNSLGQFKGHWLYF